MKLRLLKLGCLIFGLFVLSLSVHAQDRTPKEEPRPRQIPKVNGLCPETFGDDIDAVANKRDVDPGDLSKLIGSDKSQDQVASLYKCLLAGAKNADKSKNKKGVTADDIERVKTNLRKLAGFINNIPSGSRAEAGINFNFSGLTSEALAQHAQKLGAPSSFENRFDAVNDGTAAKTER